MWLDYIYNKIIKFVGIFIEKRHKLNFEMAKMVYFPFVHSHLIYGIEIYGNTYNKHLSKLMILNNKILHLLQKAPINTRSYIQISIQCLYQISINFKFWNLCIDLYITRFNYLQFILIILTKIAYFILTTRVLKMLSIPSRLEVLSGKDLSHIKKI